MASLAAHADDPAAVARLIRSAREHAELSQAALASRLRTTQSVISRWESGRDTPRLATLSRILRTCGFRLSVVAEPDDVDRAQIREQLARTPAQRLASVRNTSRFVTAGRAALARRR